MKCSCWNRLANQHQGSLIGMIHSVSKETHHEFLGFPCDPGSRSSDPGRVIFEETSRGLARPSFSDLTIGGATSPVNFGAKRGSCVYTLPKKKRNFSRCVSFETECTCPRLTKIRCDNTSFLVYGRRVCFLISYLSCLSSIQNCIANHLFNWSCWYPKIMKMVNGIQIINDQNGYTFGTEFNIRCVFFGKRINAIKKKSIFICSDCACKVMEVLF